MESISRHERVVVALIVVAYMGLVLAFGLGPIFEGPDEISHYQYIRTIKLTHSLPDPYTDPGGENHQAPLYYLLMTPTSMLLGDSDFPVFSERLNPYIGAAFRIPGNDNKNQFLHTRAEAFPYSGSQTALAIHLLRLCSLAMGLATLASCYATFRLLWPERPDLRLMALGFAAFMPQFTYLSSVVSNDNLLFLLSSVSLLLLVRQQVFGPSWKWALLLGAVLGAALLTKLSADFLAIPVGVSLLLDRRAWRYVPVILLLVVAIAGWWYLRNLILYGDPTGMQVYFQTIPGDVMQAADFTLFGILSRLAYIYQTFWARFGYVTVPVSDAIYDFYTAVTLFIFVTLPLCVIRLIRGARNKEIAPLDLRCTLVVVTFGLAWIGAVLYSSMIGRTLIQGRFALPGLAAFAAAFSLSIDTWSPQRFKGVIAPLTATIMGIIAGVCVFGYFLPAFRVQPAPTTIEQPLSIRYEDAAELIGIAPAMLDVHPGQTTQITLYWRALGPTRDSLQVYLHSLDEKTVLRKSVPGTGNLPSFDWQIGETWAETYTLFIPIDAAPGSQSPILVSLFDPVTGRELAANDANGVQVTPEVGRVIVAH
jgi:hypothetical protein